MKDKCDLAKNALKNHICEGIRALSVPSPNVSNKEPSGDSGLHLNAEEDSWDKVFDDLEEDDEDSGNFEKLNCL